MSSDVGIYAAIEDAIRSAMSHHEPLQNGSVCACEVRNNMDGDALFSHRVSAVSDAVREVIDDFNIDY